MKTEGITPGRRLIIGYKGLGQKNGKSRSTNWRKIRDDKHPPPIEIGPNSVAWFEDEVDDWLASRPRRRYRATVDPASGATDDSVPAAEPALPLMPGNRSSSGTNTSSDRQFPDQRAARRRSRRARNIPGGRDA
jgi:prophage regulatory protein